MRSFRIISATSAKTGRLRSTISLEAVSQMRKWPGRSIVLPGITNTSRSAKRPEYLHDGRAKEWSDWNRAYYRFHLDPHQQVALERLASLAGLDALVTYASPAFHTYSELWDHVSVHAVLDNTKRLRAKLNGRSCLPVLFDNLIGLRVDLVFFGR